MTGSAGRINQLFEGRRQSSGEKGDDTLREKDLVSVQIHQLNVTRDGSVLVQAPALAVHFPDDFKPQDTIYQDKVGQTS